MSKRGELRRAQRDDAKLDQYVNSGFIPWGYRPYHGICRRVTCGRRTYLNMPAKVCNKCMPDLAGFVWAAKQFGVRL